MCVCVSVRLRVNVRERERERFELHTVSILRSLNDLNKEFNTGTQ